MELAKSIKSINVFSIEACQPHGADENHAERMIAVFEILIQLFYYNAFVMLSNGVDAKIGTLGSKYAFFHEWKRLKEDEVGCVALETMLRGVCRKENFLDLFENFILFDHSEGKTVKILARNHQYLGVNEAVKAYHARKLKDGRLGVFWHTQGSGKSYSMVFLAQKIRRKFEGQKRSDRRSNHRQNRAV
jgi:type I restriction enzyme, R subunit